MMASRAVPTTAQPADPLTLEFVPTRDDLLHVRRLAFRRALFNPPALMLFCGCLLLAVGGAMMACIGSALWQTLAWLGFFGFILLALGFSRLVPTPAKVDREFATRPWLSTPVRVEATSHALVYEHGPLRARLSWRALCRLTETDHALLLEEMPAPGALFYSLPKRELNRTPGGAGAWRTALVKHMREAHKA